VGRLISLVAVLALAAACSGADDTGSGPTTTPTTTPASSTTTTMGGTSGCGAPPPEVGDDRLVRATLESSGGTREYLVYVPEGYDPDAPAPVAFVFHGAGSTKEERLVYSGYQSFADEDGALLVLPDALGSPARWSPLGAAIAGVAGVNDLVLFDDLLATVESDLCIDPERLLVTGMSSGGFMAAAVACTRSDRVTAVGPVTATVPADALCVSAEAVPYAYFHGTADAVVPYDGGPGSPGPVEESSQSWADHNGCVGSPRDELIGTEVVHRSWAGCDAPTDLYTVEGGGHSWPGAVEVARLGYTTQDIDASEIIWTMFRNAWPDEG
jgi:polyhydroxybutyrate depolymerase